MATALVAVIFCRIQAKGLAGSAEEFEPLYFCQTVAIERQQGEAELDYNILHGKIASKEDYAVRLRFLGWLF